MRWILDLLTKSKPWLPGQTITGAMAFHDHFPDRTKHGVRIQKIREVAKTLQDYDRAIQKEMDPRYGLQYNIKKAAIAGGIAFAVLCLLSLPIGRDIVSYGAFRFDLLGGPMILMNCIAFAFVGIFFWSGYKKKMEEVDRHKAYWKYQPIGNHVLVHVLTEPFGLVPRYSRKDLIVMNEPFTLNDGTFEKKIKFAPQWIPRNFVNRLPSKFRVKSEDGNGLIKPSDDQKWPATIVPISYWKFEYERPFRLTLGEIYMEDGRWSNRPQLVKNDPAGLYTGTIIFGGTGTGKSIAALLNYVFQILAWNSQIDSEAKAIDYLETIGKNLKVGDQDEFGWMPLEAILKLSNEAYDKMQEEGKGFAFEKMFLVLFEPKGEMHVDIRAQLKILGRANDFVELGTDNVQIDKWRTARQQMHSASMGVFGMWDYVTLENDLRSGMVAHMQPFWKSEIIRRFKSKEWNSLGSGFSVANVDLFVPTPLTLKDFSPDAKTQIPSGSTVNLPNGKTASGDTALSDILKALDETTGKVATQLYSLNSFGANEIDPNLFTGFVFRKDKVLRLMGSGFQEGNLVDPVREALIDCLGMLASATGVLQTGTAKPGELGGAGIVDNTCDGLFRGLSAHKREGGLLPAFRGISLLPLPTVPEGEENSLPDIPQLIAGDLNGKSPLDDDEERILKIVRTAAPAVRRSSGEPYDEYVSRKGVVAILAAKRHKEFQEQFRRVCASCSRLLDSGYEIREAYEHLHEVIYKDSLKDLERCCGDHEFELLRKEASEWQKHLRAHGYSPIAERANGEFDEGVRVGLQPIDAAWNTGCWESLSHLVEKLVAQIISEAVKKALGVSYSDHSTKVGTGLKIHCHRFFEGINHYVEAVHQYYAVMTPATMGFVVRKVKDHHGLEKAVNERVERTKKSDPVAHERLTKAWGLYVERGLLGGDLVDGAGGEWFKTMVLCNGTNQFNPLYQPDVSPESISSELGAALTAGDRASGETFWSDAYTTMAGQYIGLTMAATGWVNFNDVLNCFMHQSYRARLLMMAEARLDEMRTLYRRVQDPTVVTGPTVQVWGEQALAEAQVAEREWELAQLRDMTGMELGAGEWLGSFMDGGKVYRSNEVVPQYGVISSQEMRSMAPGAKVPDSQDLIGELGLERVLSALRESGSPVPEAGNGVLRKIAGAYLRDLGDRIAGEKKKVLGKEKLQISKTLCDAFLNGQLVYGITTRWEFRKWKECLASGEEALRVALVPPLTPPPILGAQIQSLQSTIEGYKNFDAVALRGDALKDSKTKGNVLISYMVKVFGLRSEGALYSFSPRSRYSITFPNFDEVRTRGLVVVSRITESVYQDVGMLISRMAIQQFQRTIKSRAGRQKTLLYGTNEAPPRIDTAHQKAHQGVKMVVERLVPKEEEGGGGSSSVAPSDPKGRLDHYVRQVHAECDGAFSGLLSAIERERLNGVSQKFLRQVRVQLGSSLGSQLPDDMCDRVVLETLAFLGMVHAQRLGDSLASGMVGQIEEADPGHRRAFQDDQVLRGMAVFANFSEIGYQVGKAYGRVFDRQITEKLQRLFHQALGEYQSMLSFARMQGDTERLRFEGQKGVEFVVARRDLLSEVAVIQDEPDFRRLGALVQDEVQKTVIPSTQKTDGDGGYLEVARAGMCFNIFATQFPNSLKKNLGEDFKRYLGNLLTWVCLMIPDPDDAKLVVEMFGVEDEGQSLQVEGSLQGVASTAEGLRGRTDDLNVKYDSKAERKSVISVHDLMGLEAMQGYVRWRDGQRTRRGKLYTTPAFIVTGQIQNPVNPYGPKGLLLRAEEKLSRNPEWVMSRGEAMSIVEDHGLPWVEEPVVVLIQHRMIDMSKSVTGEEAERDARLHANRAYLQVSRR